MPRVQVSYPPIFPYPRMSSQTFEAQFALHHNACNSYENLKLVRSKCYDTLSDADKWQSEFLKEHYILDTLNVKSEVFIPSRNDINFLSTPFSYNLEMHSYKDTTCSNKVYKLRHYIAYVESILIPRINSFISRYGCRIELVFADMSQSYDNEDYSPTRRFVTSDDFNDPDLYYDSNNDQYDI